MASIGELMYAHLEDEMRRSYLDYSMSVIVGRALPDIRDGFKPVHRRILYAMHELKNEHNQPHKKAARIVGDIIGKYHPHGDAAVYDALVRMVQAFSLRYPLVDGQGNFGSVDGDSPAAMRYTEVRMERIAHELLADLDKDTVDFIPNYDNSEQEPAVLPTKIPNLLVNGSSGIAVGMATNIPPHNIGEIIEAILALIDNPQITIQQLLAYVPGPDFPTAGLIRGRRGIYDAYHTGRGNIVVRARAHTETAKSGEAAIIVTELPYRVNKAVLLNKIAQLVKSGNLAGISDLRDESDKDGMRVVITIKRGENSEIVLNNLYKHTQLQNTFGVNFVALSEGRPVLVNLKQALDAFIRHRREVVTRRLVFDLHKARERTHILESLTVALENIDEVVALIKASPTPAKAKHALLSRAWQTKKVVDMLDSLKGGQTESSEITRLPALPAHFGLQEDGYYLSPEQAQAILDLRLHRLTSIEQGKVTGEYKSHAAKIRDLLDILSNPDRLTEVICSELREIRDQYSDDRRTEIIEQEDDLMPEDLIKPENVIGTLSHKGYVKTQSLTTFDVQHRGGVGKAAATTGDGDSIRKIFVANTHDTLLCFSSFGKVYWIKVYRLPSLSRLARGRPLTNMLPLAANERITAMLPVAEWSEDTYAVMVTARGKIKKVPLSQYSRPRSSGIIAMRLGSDDSLVGVGLIKENTQVFLFGSHGKMVRFDSARIRAMGRQAIGVRGMKLPEGGRVKSLICMDAQALNNENILVITENGYGKRVRPSAFLQRSRNTKGVRAIRTDARNGAAVKALSVADDDEIILVADKGKLIRINVGNVSLVGRNARGVRVVRLENDAALIDAIKVVKLSGVADEQ